MYLQNIYKKEDFFPEFDFSRIQLWWDCRCRRWKNSIRI